MKSVTVSMCACIHNEDHLLNAPVHNPSFSSWHYARRQVAESYLKTLSSGVMLSTTVYAPPQTGLTQFFINDVIPCAHGDRYVTAYVDLSDPKIPATAAMLMGLERVMAGSSVLQTGFNFLKGIFQSKDAGESKVGNYLKKSAVIDTDYFLENKDAHLALVDSYFKKILNYKSLLILVDHAHELGKDELNREFCSYFKNLISEHAHSIRPLYATSNMGSWSGVFENRRSALYSEGAFVHKLPALGKVFVRDVLGRTGRQVSMEEATRCFEMAGFRPGIFVGLLLGWDKGGDIPLSHYFYRELEALKGAGRSGQAGQEAKVSQNLYKEETPNHE